MVSGGLGGAGDVAWWRAEAVRWRAEAERLAGDNAVLQARVVELEGQVGALGEKVATLARSLFGPSSEKTKKPVREDPEGEDPAGDDDDPAGGGPAGGGDDPAGEDPADERPKRRGRGQRRGSRGHGRRDYSHLRTREQIHDLPAGERLCPCCGAGYTPFGQETCEQIDWQVELTRIVHRRPTYRRTCRCPVRGVLAAPPVPKAIAKGR
ncbi:MAG: hypothetical protein ACR2GH_14435, partial [Pseudonocardia sp.]